MSKAIEHRPGERFGELTVLRRSRNVGRQPGWLCRCSCGNVVIAIGYQLRNGLTISCGHVRRERWHRWLRERYRYRPAHQAVSPEEVEAEVVARSPPLELPRPQPADDWRASAFARGARSTHWLSWRLLEMCDA